MSKIIEGLKYSESHEWVKVEGNVAVSVKASSDLYCPVSGKVVEVNEELEDAPEKVNEDAFAAWIIKVEMSDASELDALMDAAAYKAMIGE